MDKQLISIGFNSYNLDFVLGKTNLVLIANLFWTKKTPLDLVAKDTLIYSANNNKAFFCKARKKTCTFERQRKSSIMWWSVRVNLACFFCETANCCCYLDTRKKGVCWLWSTLHTAIWQKWILTKMAFPDFVFQIFWGIFRNQNKIWNPVSHFSNTHSPRTPGSQN